jgi:hypothetical protein
VLKGGLIGLGNCGLIAGAFSSTSGKADSVLTTKGDLATYSTKRIREAVGTNNYTLTADSAQATGIKWGASATSTLTAAGDLLVASGANTLSRLAKGSDNQTLMMNGTSLNWETAAAGGNLKLLESETLDADTSGWSLTFDSAYDFNDYSNFFIILESDADGTDGATDLSMQLNGNSSSNYHWIMQKWTSTTQTLSKGVAQTAMVLTENYTQAHNNYTWMQLYVNDFPTGERYGEWYSASVMYTAPTTTTTAYGSLGATVTDFSQILFTAEGDGDILAGSRLYIYGFAR